MATMPAATFEHFEWPDQSKWHFNGFWNYDSLLCQKQSKAMWTQQRHVGNNTTARQKRMCAYMCVCVCVSQIQGASIKLVVYSGWRVGGNESIYESVCGSSWTLEDNRQTKPHVITHTHKYIGIEWVEQQNRMIKQQLRYLLTHTVIRLFVYSTFYSA